MSTLFSEPMSIPQVPQQTVYPLEAGDRLNRDEFERRYHAMRNVKKAELIEGVVYIPSPVRQDVHSGPNSAVVGAFFTYAAHTPGAVSGDNGTIRLDLDNEPQPDAFLFLPKGGQAKLDADGYVEGAPELVAEVAASSASYDLHAKMTAYRRNKVCEYLVWRVLDGEFDWFVLRGSQYERLTPVDGVFRSEVFPGLWFDAANLLKGDFAAFLATLQKGLASEEHRDFKARISQL